MYILRQGSVGEGFWRICGNSGGAHSIIGSKGEVRPHPPRAHGAELQLSAGKASKSGRIVRDRFASYGLLSLQRLVSRVSPVEHNLWVIVWVSMGVVCSLDTPGRLDSTQESQTREYG